MASPESISKPISAVVDALLESLRAHDPYSYGHCKRVGKNASLLAELAGLNPFEQRLAEYAGLLHDIGKVGIPDQILKKQGALTESEEEVMRTHCLKSVAIVSPLAYLPFFRALLPAIRHHHERIDGLGYPDGLHSRDIPVLARIVTIADAFDAITTRRPYRDQSPDGLAYQELQAHSGTQFDIGLAKLFVAQHPTWAGETPDLGVQATRVLDQPDSSAA